jgi:hypothetical protein
MFSYYEIIEVSKMKNHVVGLLKSVYMFLVTVLSDCILHTKGVLLLCVCCLFSSCAIK